MGPSSVGDGGFSMNGWDGSCASATCARVATRMATRYVDISLRDLPLSFRLGKQQVVWGETDSFRMLDRANPLDLTWHQVYESWDDLRVPLWMIKGLWEFGYVGPLHVEDTRSSVLADFDQFRDRRIFVVSGRIENRSIRP